ncbi:ankyrin repeat domain-containing protein [Jiangella asiatica]|uniref:Ankyrin repeat domain-containing protein n=1 Tax=Jiangella asiatica TaxID=2530372 RepID=A0A4R5DCB2_9ACTN|nr:ankyrin repeat domain-containing protein [Jiangella asiatica]TDE09640.1 ankyrin repeat domain-containing protein [Jiangella asiatica]
MSELPERPHLDHLKKQAKRLLRAYRAGDHDAMERLRAGLPAAAGLDDTALSRLGLRLRDAQSCVAREHGFASWARLRAHVESLSTAGAEPDAVVRSWLRLVYAGGTAGGTHVARPAAAARWLAERPDLAAAVGADPSLACAVGDVGTVRAALASDPGWVHRPGGQFGLPPLVAVTHSSLVRLPERADGIRACARLLLEHGADPDQSFETADGHRLSALYGAAGLNHDVELTRTLLDGGADPDDDESLYHSLDDSACTRLLLDAGARITGTNAMYRVFDFDDVGTLRLLLDAGADPNEPSPTWGSPLLLAIRRRRSATHVRMLLDAGADPHAVTPDGVGAYRLALRFGLAEVAELLHAAGAVEAVDIPEMLVAACASGDAEAVGRLLAGHPHVVGALSASQLRLLPDLAAAGGAGAGEAVRLMVDAGWPIDTRGGDWDASALNHAVFRGDAELTRFLLSRGASVTARHGYGDTVAGTLSWASMNGDGGGDWAGCARALLDHGLVVAEGYEFADDVAAVLTPEGSPNR